MMPRRAARSRPRKSCARSCRIGVPARVGLFLTSGVSGAPDAAMSGCSPPPKSCAAANASAILHLKIIPGASDAAIERALALASASPSHRNAGAEHFAKLTTRKDYLQSVIAPLKRIAALTAKGAPFERVKTSTSSSSARPTSRTRKSCATWAGSTGAWACAASISAPTSAGWGIPRCRRNQFRHERRAAGARAPPLPDDYLLRKYGFARRNGFDGAGNLPLDVDPKEFWARRHPERFPVDVNRADKAELLRVARTGPRDREGHPGRPQERRPPRGLRKRRPPRRPRPQGRRLDDVLSRWVRAGLTALLCKGRATWPKLPCTGPRRPRYDVQFRIRAATINAVPATHRACDRNLPTRPLGTFSGG